MQATLLEGTDVLLVKLWGQGGRSATATERVRQEQVGNYPRLGNPALPGPPLDAETWHKRLGHIGYSSLSKLPDMVTGLGLPSEQLKQAKQVTVCEPCVLAKQTRASHPSSDHRADVPLGKLHADLCGPEDVASIGGNKYFKTLIDDDSGYVEIVPLKRKGDATFALQRCVAQLETLSGNELKVLRTDRGGEFINGNMQQWAGARGVRHQSAAPYTPEQNSTAERANRTIKERIRALMAEAGAPPSMWAEAAQTAAYLINRSPTVRDAHRTPLEMFTGGGPPDISNLRVWGCKAYRHIRKEDREHALAPAAEAGIFVGYEPNSTCYRILVGAEKTVKLTVDVTMDEKSFPWKREARGQAAPVERPDPPAVTLLPMQTRAQRTYELMRDHIVRTRQLPATGAAGENGNRSNPASLTVRTAENAGELGSAPPAGLASPPGIRADYTRRDNLAPSFEPRDDIVAPRSDLRADPRTDSGQSPPGTNVRTESTGEIRAAPAAKRSRLRPIPLASRAVTATSLAAPVTLENGGVNIEGEIKVPKNIGEARRTPQSQLWEDAANRELQSIATHDTYDLVDLPPGKKAISTR